MIRSVIHAQYRLCWSGDPAIDRENGLAELWRYLREWDVELLRFREGVDPEAHVTWFVCQPLSAQALIACESVEGEHRRARVAFQYAVEQVTNLDGAPWVPERIDSVLPGHRTILSDRSMDALVQQIGARVVTEIGTAIIARARMNDVEKKGSLRQRA